MNKAEILKGKASYNKRPKKENKSLIATECFSDLALNTKNSNNLYIYLGSYQSLSSIESFKRLLKPTNLENCNFNIYIDLETGQTVISDLSIEEFEKNNTVLHVKGINNNNIFQIVNKLREEFFGVIVDTTQSEAATYMIKKYEMKRK